jgi:hypothetical protein
MLPFTQHDVASLGNEGSRASTMFCPDYTGKLLSLRQMDVDIASATMIELLVNPSQVFKMASLRKQTKGRWSRDDPTFALLLSIMISFASIAYGIAFSVSFWTYV